MPTCTRVLAASVHWHSLCVSRTRSFLLENYVCLQQVDPVEFGFYQAQIRREFVIYNNRHIVEKHT